VSFYRILVVVASLAVAVARAATSTISPTGGDFSITLSASDLGIAPSYLQANASGWEEFIAWGFGYAIGYGLRVVCLSVLAASGLGAALIPLICTPLGGAVGGFAKGMLEAYFDKDFQSPSFWSNLIISTIGGAVGGFAWEKWISPFAKGPGAVAAGRIGTWLTNQAPGIASWFGAGAGATVEEFGEIWIGLENTLPISVADYDSNVPATASLPCDIYGADGTPCTAAYSMDRAMYPYYGGPLYQVQRASDDTTADIGLLTPGGDVNASAQDSFCGGTTCTVTKISRSPSGDPAGSAPQPGTGACPTPIACSLAGQPTPSMG